MMRKFEFFGTLPTLQNMIEPQAAAALKELPALETSPFPVRIYWKWETWLYGGTPGGNVDVIRIQPKQVSKATTGFSRLFVGGFPGWLLCGVFQLTFASKHQVRRCNQQQHTDVWSSVQRFPEHEHCLPLAQALLC